MLENFDAPAEAKRNPAHDNLQEFRYASSSAVEPASEYNQSPDKNAKLVQAGVLPPLELCQAKAPVPSDILQDVSYNPGGQKRATEPVGDTGRRRLVGNPLVEIVGNPPNIDQMAELIEKIPPHVRQLLQETGHKFVLTDRLGNYDRQGVGSQPRGWPRGSTWENSDGQYNDRPKEIVVSSHWIADGRFERSGRNHGVLMHETGHAVDRALGFFSFSDEFKQAYEKDVANLSPEDRQKYAYLLQRISDPNHPDRNYPGRSETFGEVFGAMHGSSANADQKAEILAKFPHVRKAIEARLEKLRNEQDAKRERDNPTLWIGAP